LFTFDISCHLPSAPICTHLPSAPSCWFKKRRPRPSGSP
jgi:hypothetical protein